MILRFSSSKRSARDILATRPCEFMATELPATVPFGVLLDKEGFEPTLTLRKLFGGPAPGRDMLPGSPREYQGRRLWYHVTDLESAVPCAARPVAVWFFAEWYVERDDKCLYALSGRMCVLSSLPSPACASSGTAATL